MLRRAGYQFADNPPELSLRKFVVQNRSYETTNQKYRHRSAGPVIAAMHLFPVIYPTEIEYYGYFEKNKQPRLFTH
jgi:hypothetical protein